MDFIKAQQVARGDQAVQEKLAAKSKLGGAMKGIVGQSYNTAVVNDPELTGMQSAQQNAASASDIARKQALAQNQAEERPFPTSVGDVDMLRIRDAEKILLEEEMIHGRMMRDEYGRLVPEALRIAQDSRKIADGDFTHPDDVHNNNNNNNNSSSSSSSSKKRRGEHGQVYEEGEDPSRDPYQSESMHALEDGMPKGKKRALREGGQLTPLQRKGTRGRTNKPRTGRARAARLDVDIKRGHAVSVEGGL
tara:strand:- start:92 stop:838 length:747 start_codon:yes stop_codon:yes gene_type:complete